MAKKKDSVALFEVIQKARQNQASMEVPKWMGGADQPSPPEPGPQEPLPRPPVGNPAGAAEPLVAVVGDRLRLSLNYTSCAAVVMGLAILLVGAFALGWWGGAGRDVPEKPGGRLKDRTPMGRHVLGGTKPPGGAAATKKVAAGASERQPGKWYLVIQGLTGTAPGDLEEARRIADWCNQRKEPATVARYTSPRSGKQRYIVWSLKPFDSPIGEPAKQYGAAIETLGRSYFAQHKTYDFRQRSGGKFDPWFEVHR